MKKTISLLIALFLVSSLSFSQTISTGKVPKSVKKTFAKDYPKAVKPLWSMSDGNYKVDFLNNGIKNAVTYDNSGAWQKKELTVSIPRIPKEIKAAFNKEFPGFRSTESIQITTPDNVIQYHLCVIKGKEAYDVYFSATGEILKKEPKQESNPVQNKQNKKK
jgi:hypothetical protein